MFGFCAWNRNDGPSQDVFSHLWHFFVSYFLRLCRVVFLAKDGTCSGEALGVCRATLANHTLSA